MRLTLVSRETHDRTLQFPAPLRDPRVLRTLILLDLESHPPPAGIDRVTVMAEPVPARTLQCSLLEQALPSAERLSTLLARLTVLMGDRRCGVPVVADSHQPDAFETSVFNVEAIRDPQVTPASSQPLVPVLRRFRNPVSARVVVEHGQPVRVAAGQQRSSGGHIVASAGPWRTSGQWWQPISGHLLESPSRKRIATDMSPRKPDRHDVPVDSGRPSSAATTLRSFSWSRDEWDVALSDGGVYRIFRDHTSNRWFVEGMVD